MTIPKIYEVYKYKDVLYIVRAQSLFHYVYVQDYIINVESRGSIFNTFNWFDFALKAKHIGTTKKNDAY